MRYCDSGLVAALLVLTVPQPLSAATKQDAKLIASYDLLRADRQDRLEETKIDLIVKQEGASYGRVYPGATDKEIELFRSSLRQELGRYSMQMIDMKARYYADHFSLPELREWTGMVRSRVGQKVVAAAPEIMRDLYAVDTIWIKAAVAKAIAKVRQSKAVEANRP